MAEKKTRAKKAQPKAKRIRYVEVPLPPGFPAIGAVVRYYSNGWRHGSLESITKGIATVRHIGGSARTIKMAVGFIEIPVDTKVVQVP